MIELLIVEIKIEKIIFSPQQQQVVAGDERCVVHGPRHIDTITQVQGTCESSLGINSTGIIYFWSQMGLSLFLLKYILFGNVQVS